MVNRVTVVRVVCKVARHLDITSSPIFIVIVSTPVWVPHPSRRNDPLVSSSLPPLSSCPPVPFSQHTSAGSTPHRTHRPVQRGQWNTGVTRPDHKNTQKCEYKRRSCVKHSTREILLNRKARGGERERGPNTHKRGLESDDVSCVKIPRKKRKLVEFDFPDDP